MSRIKGKRAVITGASSGIGESIAVALARAGASVVLCGRDTERLAAVQARCSALGAPTQVHAADVADEAAMQSLAAELKQRSESVDILVNNAGVVMGGLCWEVEPDDWRRLHEINVMGVVHGIRAFVPQMIQRGGGGHIVNMASVSGFVGVGGMATYSASKFAVVGLSESLRAELHRYRIGVSTVCPGFVRTPIQSKVKLVGSLDTPRSRARVDRDFARSTLMPDEVARCTLRAIERNQALVYPGREARMAALMHRIAPGLLARMIRG